MKNLHEDDGPPSVPNLGLQPTPPSGPIIQPTSPGGGWARGGPFRPYSGGGHWAGELYSSIKQLAVASKILKRFKELGIAQPDQKRVKNAYGVALKNTRDLIRNPQKTAYHFPQWTTKNTMPKIPFSVWNEAFEDELFDALLNEVTDKNDGDAWEVEYAVFPKSNKDKPLYSKKQTIYAPTEKEAREFVEKRLSRNILSIKKLENADT